MLICNPKARNSRTTSVLCLLIREAEFKNIHNHVCKNLFYKNAFTIADGSQKDFRNHSERRLRYFPDALTADKAAEIIGYAPHTVLSYIRQKRIFAVQISGKYILPKTALVDFLTDDFAFEIVHKSMWHMNTILLFVEKE